MYFIFIWYGVAVYIFRPLIRYDVAVDNIRLCV